MTVMVPTDELPAHGVLGPVLQSLISLFIQGTETMAPRMASGGWVGFIQNTLCLLPLKVYSGHQQPGWFWGADGVEGSNAR